MDWFTSDVHFGEEKLHRLNRPQFADINEAKQTILKNFEVVKKGDRLFILGDLGFGKKEVAEFLEPLLKRKVYVIWVRGNHDKDDKWKTDKYIAPNLLEYLKQCDSMTVKAAVMYNRWYHPLYLSHYPHVIWDRSHYGICFHLYGHSHKETSDVPWTKAIMQGRSLNVNVELHDYKPWSRDEIEEVLSNKSPNIDFYLCKGNEEDKKKAIACCEDIKKRLAQFYDEVDFKVYDMHEGVEEGS